MSRFSGPQCRGAMRTAREVRRVEAEERQQAERQLYIARTTTRRNALAEWLRSPEGRASQRFWRDLERRVGAALRTQTQERAPCSHTRPDAQEPITWKETVPMQEQSRQEAQRSLRYERGPLQKFEITWTSGHVETVQGHQCIAPNGGLMAAFLGPTSRPDYVTIHGEFDGRWVLVLRAPAEDIRIIRNVTAGEAIPGGDLR